MISQPEHLLLDHLIQPAHQDLWTLESKLHFLGALSRHLHQEVVGVVGPFFFDRVLGATLGSPFAPSLKLERLPEDSALALLVLQTDLKQAVVYRQTQAQKHPHAQIPDTEDLATLDR